MNAHRIKAFCDWLDTIPPDPPFFQHPGFRFFADLSPAEIDAAIEEMGQRESDAIDAIVRLEAEKIARLGDAP